ncbi:hypothetical protein BH09PAT4_BH09PAT4_08070 [soil metagenome]
MAERQAIRNEFPSGLPLPPLQVTDRQPLEAPVLGTGSFLYANLDRAEAKLPLAPVDEFTGLPLPILQVEPPPSALLDWRKAQEACRSDNHHAFFPKDEYSPTAAGRVLRHSRVQYGGRWAHARYHTLYSGVPLPRDIRSQFALAVLATAGFIPDEAVDIREDRPERALLSPSERLEMQEETLRTEVQISGTTGLDINRSNRGIFFMSYALEQSFDQVSTQLVDEFLGTEDARRRLRLGFHLVDIAFQEAVAEIEDVYSVARRQGYIHPSRPDHPTKLIRQVVHGHQPNYFRALQQRLSELAIAS